MLHVLWLLSVLAAVGPAACDVFVVNAERNLEYKMDAEMSTFGPMLAWKGMSGVLMSGRPANGCLPLEVSPPANRGGRHWFVLLAKANCTPNVQVAHGQHAGFDAVIVHNVGSNVVSPMSGYDAADIPSVFVGESNGILLEVNFLYYSGYHLVLTGNYSFTFYAFLIPCILLCFGCLLILCAIMLCRYICARRRAARRILPKKILDAIPTKRFEPATDPWDTCAVCLEDYVAGDVVRMLPCRHAFHRDCVDPWLTRTKRSCPVCKRLVLSATAAMACMDSEEDDDVMESQRGDRAPLIRPRARRTYGATSTVGRPRRHEVRPAVAPVPVVVTAPQAVEPAAVQQAHAMVHRVLAANPQPPPPPPPPAQHVPGHVLPEWPRLHGHRCPSDPRHMSDNRASSTTESVSQQAPAPAPAPAPALAPAPTSEPSMKPHPEFTVKPSSASSPDSAPEPCQSVPETGRQPCFGAVPEPGRGSCSEYAPKGDESAAVASDSVSVQVVPAADKLATPDTDQV